jgi:3,2-trans-enoyl-CoA isomerase
MASHPLRSATLFGGSNGVRRHGMIDAINHGPVRELRLNRPPVNALSGELIVALKQALDVAPREQVRALILSGAPGRFSGGLDLPVLLGLDRSSMEIVWRDFYSLLRAFAQSPIPIAAAITGHAPAGGTVLALFCDWRVMAIGDFKVGLNEVQVGIQLPPILMAGFRRLLGSRRAEYLAVSGDLVSPEEALRVGLVDELAQPNGVVQRALEWCQRLLTLPSEAMLGTRREARADLFSLFDRDLEPELQLVIASWWTAETQTSLRALAQRLKHKP